MVGLGKIEPFVTSQIEQLIKQLNEVVLDKENEIKLTVVCILAQGHLLIEDVPGVGKTTLVLSIGKLLGLDTKRIQFTVDLLPADILGGNIYNPKKQEFDFFKGPLFSELVLADELNRASPRTQSALLQAMEEGEVSIDGVTYRLPEPFMVIATQNPHHNMGTFQLPESQLDRFLMSLELKYASQKTEVEIFQNQDRKQVIKGLHALFDKNSLSQLQKSIETVKVSKIVAEYVGRLLERSRTSAEFSNALSTRAGLALVKAAKAWAFLSGRDFLKPEDIQSVLIPVLAHRLGGFDGIRKGKELANAIKSQTEVPI